MVFRKVSANRGHQNWNNCRRQVTPQRAQNGNYSEDGNLVRRPLQTGPARQVDVILAARFLELGRLQMMLVEQLVEFRTVTLGDACRMGDIAVGDLQ